MDVDPKPLDQSPTPAQEPESNNEHSFETPTEPVVSSSRLDALTAPDELVTPPVGPSAVIAAALDEETAEDKEPQTEPVRSIEPAVEKKSHKGAIIAIVTILVLIGAGAVWYVLYGTSAPKAATSNTSPTTDQSTITPATAETSSETVDAANDALTTTAADEATVSATDDSSSASDASTTAGKVGDSIDENSF